MWNKAWRQIGEVYGKFCKKLMGVLSYAANGFGEMERGRETRRGKIMRQNILVSDYVCSYVRSGRVVL
jgi:hypothetical protein